MKKLSLIVAVFYFAAYAYFIIAWLVNLYNFFSCDFEPSYKEEIIRFMGIIIPPMAGVTVYF